MDTMRWRITAKSILAGAMIFMLYAAGTGCTGSSGVYKTKAGELKMDKTYKNFINLPVRSNDGAADPFIMRYNGWYYLYTTGKVNIWKSKDLTDWKYAGTANHQKPLEAAFAPEVYYWNGRFYMYTSPAGQGHYILSSDKPEGPFDYVTENIGLSIDGSVFIEDDGRWYFTHADGKGIIGHEMLSPTQIQPGGKQLKAYLGHWTEGSMIIKRNGYYFMTYTGNHFLSRGYRVAYAVSDNGPLGRYEPAKENPILINDLDISFALGHSASVLGPDLDSMYIAYHCYSSKAPSRMLNIDRLSFNGSRMYVNGPTWFTMPAPSLPRYALWPEDHPAEKLVKTEQQGMQMLLSKENTGESFTAEFNYSGGEGDAGVAICGGEKGSFIGIVWEENNAGVAVRRYDNGHAVELGSFGLPKGFTRDALHTIRVQYSPKTMEIYFDGMHKLSVQDPGLRGGSIGYIWKGSQPEIGFTGFSDEFGDSADRKAIKPIPGKFDAVHYLLDENKGYGGNLSTGDAGKDVKTLIMEKPGAWVSYAVNVEEEGEYGIALQRRGTVSREAKLEVLADGKSCGSFAIKNSTMESADGWAVIPVGTVKLTAGLHRLAFRLAEGSQVEILSIQAYRARQEGLPSSYTLEARHKDMHVTGPEKVSLDFTEKGCTNPKGSNLMLSVGSKGWTDYAVEVEATVGKFGMGNSGILIRATNESYHEHQTMNAVQGYYAGWDGKEIFLKRMNYDATEKLTGAEYKAEPGEMHTFRVEARGSNIKIFVDAGKTPIIDFTDPQPYLFGRAGLLFYKDGGSAYKNMRLERVK